MGLLNVTDTAKKATDPVLLAALAGQGINKDGVELVNDYAARSKGKGYSPYGKLYRDLNSEKRFLVVSGLPMVDAYGQHHELEWRGRNGIIESGNNTFHAVVNRNGTRLIALSGQPARIKKGGELTFHPQLFIGGSEVQPVSFFPRLLEADPANGNYHNNVLEWDYGVCKRRVRLIEGKFLGSWVFTVNPGGDVLIKYNQHGKFRLRLKHARNHDEEYIPGGFFEGKVRPVVIADSAAFYPDANPESVSVDGRVYHYTPAGDTWGNIRGGAGTGAEDTAAEYVAFQLYSDDESSKWRLMLRTIFLFDTSGLDDGVTISSGMFSLYGGSIYAKTDQAGWAPNVNVYASNPASNTALVAGDYDSLDATAFCDTPITFAGWSTSGYNDFSLNAAGIAAISKTDITRLGVRNANYDAADSAPDWVATKNAYLPVCFSEKGAGYKPKLVVTYTAGEQKNSADAGSGIEIVTSRIQEAAEQGQGVDEGITEASFITGDAGGGSEVCGLLKSLTGGDTGIGSESLKALVEKAGPDLRLRGHRRQVGIPHKEVSL